MNWSEKSHQIAEGILKKELKARRISPTYKVEYLSSLLAEAANEGMKHECDNWIKKSR